MPFTVLYLPLQQDIMLVRLWPVALEASLIDSKVWPVSTSSTLFFSLPPEALFFSTWYEWIAFSLWVHHSKLEMRLSDLLPLMWFTNGLFSWLGIKASATNRCTPTERGFLFLNSLILLYPWTKYGDIMRSFFVPSKFRDLILPRLLTIYKPS